MEGQKVIDVVNRYLKNGRFENYTPEKAENEYSSGTKHILYMLHEIPKFIEAGRKEKAMRWLGFIQGWMWCEDIYEIKDFKNHNKPPNKPNER